MEFHSNTQLLVCTAPWTYTHVVVDWGNRNAMLIDNTAPN